MASFRIGIPTRIAKVLQIADDATLTDRDNFGEFPDTFADLPELLDQKKASLLVHPRYRTVRNSTRIGIAALKARTGVTSRAECGEWIDGHHAQKFW